MKQLHKVSSSSAYNKRDEEIGESQNHPYEPKSNKNKSLSRTLTYMLREQRLLFIIVGILIGSMLFFFQPTLLSSPSPEETPLPRHSKTDTPAQRATSDTLTQTRKYGTRNQRNPFHDKDFQIVKDHDVELADIKDHVGLVHTKDHTKEDDEEDAGRMLDNKDVPLLDYGVRGRVPVEMRRKILRIAVTGGSGFVGSHLVDQLMSRGHEVIVLDNFFTGRKENVVHHLGKPNFELIRHDVVEPILLEVDQIFHLACPASPIHYKFNPVKTIKTNVMGTLNMLGLAKRVGARFLLTSTSEVYGDPLQHPQKETYWGNVNPIGERSCYDEGKRVAETLSMDYHRGAGVEVRIARIFNTYGPRMCLDDGRVVSNFVSQAIRKQPMTIYGEGKQTRSFQYVSDLVNGFLHLMEGEHVGPFNLGNPGEFTMLELAEVVKEVIDPSATIEYKPNTADDPQMRKPDISKAKKLLNWEPKISLREGLPRMVSDFRNRILNEDEGRGNR